MKIELLKRNQSFDITVNGTIEKTLGFTAQTYNMTYIEAVVWYERYKEAFASINKKGTLTCEVLKSVTL